MSEAPVIDSTPAPVQAWQNCWTQSCEDEYLALCIAHDKCVMEELEGRAIRERVDDNHVSPDVLRAAITAYQLCMAGVYNAQERLRRFEVRMARLEFFIGEDGSIWAEGVDSSCVTPVMRRRHQ